MRHVLLVSLLLLATPAYAQEPEADVFEVVEEMPEPLGGIAAIQERLIYPDRARQEGVEGRVFVQFVVNEEGRPEDIRVVRGLGAGTGEAAVAAIAGTTFTPGRQRGRVVKVRMSLPVHFRLPDGDDGAPPPDCIEEAVTSTTVFEIVEDMPEPIGGLAAIQRELVYPEAARQAGVEGRAFVTFVVNEEGWAEDVRVVRGLGSGTDEAAIVAIARTRFTRGKQRGRIVPVQMSLPVTFRLSD